MIQTGRDERYVPEQPDSDPSEDEEEVGSDVENKKEPELDDEQKEQMLEQMRIANPSKFILWLQIYAKLYVKVRLLILHRWNLHHRLPKRTLMKQKKKKTNQFIMAKI